MTLIDEREGQGGERGVSACSERGQRVQARVRARAQGGVGGELAAESRSDQEEGRFESLSDFLLPLLRSGRKLI